jgi:hypothetical protein
MESNGKNMLVGNSASVFMKVLLENLLLCTLFKETTYSRQNYRPYHPLPEERSEICTKVCEI